jgi:UV DNA damage endonuclease
MFNQNIKRLGFCCKYMHENQNQPSKLLTEMQQQYTERQTTVAWCNRQIKQVAEQRLLEIVQHNMAAAKRLVEYAGSLPENLRMVRLGSNQIPMATEPTWRYLWQDPDVIQMLEQGFAKIGEAARAHDVRISFHPGQFCVLASDTPDIVLRSIDEFEYHATMARWMGYGKTFMDMKINVHISGRQGADGILAVLDKLSPEARNTISIENDEMCWGLDESLKLKDHVALVLDIHHHWIRDEEYISATDDRVKAVVDSWRGVRPVLHYSYSRCEHLPDTDQRHISKHSMSHLLQQGCKKQKLRAHSDFYPNTEVNQWALSFWDQFDIQCEAKAKNLATQQLYNQAIQV